MLHHAVAAAAGTICVGTLRRGCDWNGAPPDSIALPDTDAVAGHAELRNSHRDRQHRILYVNPH